LAIRVAGGWMVLLPFVPGFTPVAAAVVDAVELDAGAAAVLLAAGRSAGSLRFNGWLVDCAQADVARRPRAEAIHSGLMFIRAPEA
jgi:hypothetical protein